MPAATYRTHFQLELALEGTSRDCATAPVSGWVCMECKPFDRISSQLDSNPLRFSSVRDTHGCFPIIALATNAVIIPKGRFTSSR